MAPGGNLDMISRLSELLVCCLAGIKKRIKTWLAGELRVAICALLEAVGVRLKIFCLLLLCFL